jgi:hypothetical protein
MKKIFLLAILLVSSTVSGTVDHRPLPDSPAWHGYSESMNDEQIYFSKHF